MPRFPKSAGTSRIGPGVVQILCGQANQIWRPTQDSDIGIDGHIDFVENEEATGLSVAVQIKTGTSYINEDRSVFFVHADAAHFIYWSRLSTPVIGIVVDPDSLYAAWIDLTEQCTLDRIETGPYTVRIDRSQRTQLTPDVLNGPLRSLALEYARAKGLALLPPSANEEVPSHGFRRPATVSERMTWNQLCEDFTTSMDLRLVGSAGYRLSWYFPTVPPELERTLDTALQRMNDVDLARTLSAASLAMHSNAPNVSELIADLLHRLRGIGKRVRRLVENDVVPQKDQMCAIQILEIWAEHELPDLWVHFHEHTPRPSFAAVEGGR
jgi:hypothetical protein